MEEDLLAYLLAQAGVQQRVGTRVYWAQRPQASALPSITVQRISDIPSADECGAHNLTETRVQIDCWGKSGFEALNASRAIKAALSGKSFNHGGTEFAACYVDGGRDSVEPGSTSGSVIYRTRIDVQIWSKEI